MRILLIEDEHYAAKRLEKLILQALPDATIVGVMDTVQESIAWLSSHIEPSLIFMDIQLADGLSFQIFDKIKLRCPIIFTTAYDDYALQAFKVNSIDYLLKPIEEEALRKAINKYQAFFPRQQSQEINWNQVMAEMFHSKDHYKQRFLIKSGNAYAYLNTSDIRLIYSEDSLSFALNSEGNKYMIDQSLDKITDQLDPNKFFRINRKHIIALDSIHKVHPYLNNRLKLEMQFPTSEELIVSREKARDFKAWLDS